MTSHPNRNWRNRMLNSLYQWLQTNEGRVATDVPIRDAPKSVIDALTERVCMAYKAGYQDGRKTK